MSCLLGSSGTPARSSIGQESLTEESLRLQTYNDGFCGFESPTPRQAEIIFFHDILWQGYHGSPVQPWMSDSKPSVCWPKAWLSAKYHARILFARYDAAVRKTATEGRMRLFIIAENLVQDVTSICKERTCPIFLVGYGFGGLVIKKLVTLMHEQRGEKRDQLEKTITHSAESTKLSKELCGFDCFLDNVKGVFYFNTPVLGSTLANPSKCFLSRGALLRSLEVFSPDVAILNESFRKWRTRRGCGAKAIWASRPTKVPMWYGHWCNYVAEEAAARPDVDSFYTADKDHFSVCKLSSEAESSLHRLFELIESYPKIEAIAQVHITHVVDSDEKESCVQLLNDLLCEIQDLGKKEGLHVNKDVIEKFQKFPELWSRLEDSLRDAGLVKTYENAEKESWQPRS